MANQITIFLENTEGRLGAATHAISEIGARMSALTIAETADFGLVRILCDQPEEALSALKAAGFRAQSTPVVVVEISDETGGLSSLLDIIDAHKINIEYAYCFSIDTNKAHFAMKLADETTTSAACAALKAAGFSSIA